MPLHHRLHGVAPLLFCSVPYEHFPCTYILYLHAYNNTGGTEQDVQSAAAQDRNGWSRAVCGYAPLEATRRKSVSELVGFNVPINTL